MKQNLFVHNGRPLVSEVICDGDLKESIKRSISLIGGINKLVKRGDTILLRPNYNTADSYPGSSDPNFIKAVIEMLYEAGAGKVIVGERSAYLDTWKALEKAGIIKTCEEAGAELRVFGRNVWLAFFDRKGWRRVNVPEGQYLRRVSLARKYLKQRKLFTFP